MPKFTDVISTLPDGDKSTQEHFTEIYRQIGIYFINNAERLGANVVDNVSDIDIFISLKPREIVTIDFTQKELLMKQKLTANASIGKVQVEPQLNFFLNKQDVDVDRVVKEISKKIETEIKGVMDNE